MHLSIQFWKANKMVWPFSILVFLSSICMSCKNGVEIDPAGDSYFYIINAEESPIMVSAEGFVLGDSILTGWRVIHMQDTGFIGKASGIGSPEPINVFSRILIRSQLDSSIVRTIEPIEDSLWICDWVETNGAYSKINWYLKSQMD